MKYLSKYNSYLNESNSDEINNIKLDIIDMLQDLIDDKYRIKIDSMFGSIIIKDGKTSEVGEFKPIYKAGNKIKSYLSISIYTTSSSGFTNDEFSNIIAEMSANIDRLGDKGWNQSDFNVERYKSTRSTPFRLTEISYKFRKPDIISDGEVSDDDIKNSFENLGLYIDDINRNDNIITVGAYPMDYNGRIPDSIKERLDNLIDILGFDYYEVDNSGDWLTVKFWIDPNTEE